ncbi:type II toxin-antitoxin system VapC family toxin [Mucilaginibacter sp. CAU 1740]|uniref:type II toxin-antitoxin system VapC family toxin n=1 Tax=Mucilaginibacter sp. CAU 1740 TaxID=3140365 RepID=UPI00325B128A
MNLLLDTNILLYLSKNPEQILKNIPVDLDNDRVYLSIVSIGELKSIAFQNNWSIERWEVVKDFYDSCNVLEVNETLINAYSQIDAYSQRRNPGYDDYPFTTPRNMGKNDLWIASTAALLGLTLVTTDKDFDHLNQVFMEVKRISPEDLLSPKK